MTVRALYTILCLLMAAVLTQPVAAADYHIQPEILSEHSVIAPGQASSIALTMAPEPGWHGYWLNGGAAGFALQDVRWTVPAGVQIGAPQFPVPKAKTLFGRVNHVYETPYAILFPVQFPKNLAADTPITIMVTLNWLACSDTVCVPESGSFTTYMKAGAASSAPNAAFAGFRQALPRPLDQTGLFARAQVGQKPRINFSIPLPASVTVIEPHLFVVEQDVVDPNGVQTFTRTGDRLFVEIDAPGKGNTAAPPQTISAVLRLNGAKGSNDANGLAINFQTGSFEIPGIAVPLPKTTAAMTVDWALIATALAGAVLGGFLLNLMPCVFPILSLKAIGLAKLGQDKMASRREAWAYLAGAVAMALLLGGILLLLRSIGAQFGWAFQLQHPISILLLIALFTAMTANLAGLFELGGFGGGEALAGQGGSAGSFWTGALAAFVATPCSGPFLGAALGATLVLPAWASLAIFGGLGFGLALPFVAIAYSDRMRRMLPAPGAWMNRFRRWMAVPMALTTLALIWLFMRQVSTTQAEIGIMVAMFTIIMAWFAGRGQRAGESVAGIAILGAILLVPMALLLRDWQPPASTAVASSAMPGAKPYSADALAAARAQNRPVFIDVTADWCVTCKVNEASAINRSDTVAAFKSAKVQVLIADWTNGDPAITAMLAAQGRNSVPLYLWYAPGAAAPEILPQILTTDMLVSRAKTAR